MSTMNSIRNISVFCGSKAGHLPIYQEAAERLADAMSAAGMTLLFGGANVGLMNTLANRMLQHGSPVIGVIPESLVEVEAAHLGLTELHIVGSMHERKNLLIKLADAFITLPGSIGSLDEFFEVFVLNKLRYMEKPYAILNTGGYYDHLLKQLDYFVEQGFEKKEVRDSIIVCESPEELIQHFSSKALVSGL